MNYYDLNDILASQEKLKVEMENKEIQEIPFWLCSKLAEK